MTEVKTKGQPNFRTIRLPLPNFISGGKSPVVKLAEMQGGAFDP